MRAGLRPVRIGAIAAEVLRHDGETEVVAVFERSFYVAAPGGLVCVGHEELGDGPLNVSLAFDGDRANWSDSDVTREAKGTVTSARLAIGDRFSISLAEVPVWLPPPWKATTRVQLQRSLAAIRVVAPPMSPEQGLSALVFDADGRGDHSAQAAAETVSQLRRSLVAAFASSRVSPELVRSATLLLGLGPGLTPSGDDLLGGVLLVMSALGRPALRDELWTALEPELDLLTVDVSAAHLAAAADGMGAMAVHGALNAILDGDVTKLPAHLSVLRQIGHSSGFDTLAGLVLAGEAALAANLAL